VAAGAELVEAPAVGAATGVEASDAAGEAAEAAVCARATRGRIPAFRKISTIVRNREAREIRCGVGVFMGEKVALKAIISMAISEVIP
jgi:hypothetical protein